MFEVREELVMWVIKCAFSFQLAHAVLGLILLTFPLIPVELNEARHANKLDRIICSVKHYDPPAETDGERAVRVRLTLSEISEPASEVRLEARASA